MATIPYMPVRLVGNGALKEPRMLPAIPAQNAAWRAGDILQNITTGTFTAPPGVGVGAGLAAAAAPASSAITLGTATSAGAAAATYYGVVTYTATSQETVPSAQFVINCAAGTVPTVNVASAGAPGAATNYAVYLGLQPGMLSLQQATKTTTALGTAYTAVYPLTNSMGVNKTAANPSSGIVGLACTDSDANPFGGIGGSLRAGLNSTLYGATMTVPPLTPADAQYLRMIGLGQNQLIEINLVQTVALSLNLKGATGSLQLDATSGFPYIDTTTGNAIFTITEFRQGAYIGPTASGTLGDLGARVIGYFNSGLALQ